MALFNNIPCRPRITAQQQQMQSSDNSLAGYSMNGAAIQHAPVIAPATDNQLLPYCDQITIVDELVQWLKDNPLMAVLIAAGLFFIIKK